MQAIDWYEELTQTWILCIIYVAQNSIYVSENSWNLNVMHNIWVADVKGIWMDAPQLSKEFLQLQIGILIWDLTWSSVNENDDDDDDDDDELMMLEVEKVGKCKDLQMQNW